MTEIRVKATKPLPEPLPEGEHVLWQQSPHWRAFGRRTFLLDKIALYFGIIVSWVAIAAYFEGGGGLAVLRALSWSLPPTIGVLGMIALFSWLYARTSVYTITNKRVVIQSGLALETSVNLPFSKIDKADLQSFKDGTGEIDLEISGPRLLYSMIWPNVRFFRLKRPQPVLRALQQPQRAADILGAALAAEQPAENVSEQSQSDFQSDIGRAPATLDSP